MSKQTNNLKAINCAWCNGHRDTLPIGMCNLHRYAHDLLESCKAFVRIMEEINPPHSGFSSYDRIVQAARALIAKAEGQ